MQREKIVNLVKAADILEAQKCSVPQFLEGVDEKYYEALVRDIEEYIKITQ